MAIGTRGEEKSLHEPFDSSDSERIGCGQQCNIPHWTELGTSHSVDLETRGAATPIECISLEVFIYLSQMKRLFPDGMGKLCTFQDSEEVAPHSHEFVRGLAAKGPELLGIKQWPCGDRDPDSIQRDLQSGEHEESVWLHIECVAAGTNECMAKGTRTQTQVRTMQHSVRRQLTPFFNGKLFPIQAIGGVNGRYNTEASMPLNLDNSCVLAIALLDDAGSNIIGSAVLSIYGPALGYLPFFAVKEPLHGKGWGARFGRSLTAVLRFLGVEVMIVEACADIPTRCERVVRFWEQKVGLERCSDEYFDNQEVQTNESRGIRICGSTVREMTGIFAFPDCCMMFRSTAQGWKVGHSQVPPLPAHGDLDVCGGLGAVPRIDPDICQRVYTKDQLTSDSGDTSEVSDSDEVSESDGSAGQVHNHKSHLQQKLESIVPPTATDVSMHSPTCSTIQQTTNTIPSSNKSMIEAGTTPGIEGALVSVSNVRLSFVLIVASLLSLRLIPCWYCGVCLVCSACIVCPLVYFTSIQ